LNYIDICRFVNPLPVFDNTMPPRKKVQQRTLEVVVSEEKSQHFNADPSSVAF